jgi:hypothetical protein
MKWNSRARRLIRRAQGGFHLGRIAVMRFAVPISVVSLFLFAPASYADEVQDLAPQAGVTAPNGGNTILAQYGGEGRIYVTSATYGGNCGVPRGTVTYALAQACNGRRVCEYVVHHRILGDPIPCPKDFVVTWQCGDGQPRRAGAPPEAGYGSLVVLSCRGGWR